MVSASLKRAGINLKVVKYEKILGIDVAGGGKRIVKTQKHRLKKAGIRTKSIKFLASRFRGARKLFNTGAIPQATWGFESFGFANTVINKIRVMAGHASGIATAGRCLTTAIALAYGPHNDPMISLFIKQIVSFAKTMAKRAHGRKMG